MEIIEQGQIWEVILEDEILYMTDPHSIKTVPLGYRVIVEKVTKKGVIKAEWINKDLNGIKFPKGEFLRCFKRVYLN